MRWLTTGFAGVVMAACSASGGTGSGGGSGAASGAGGTAGFAANGGNGAGISLDAGGSTHGDGNCGSVTLPSHASEIAVPGNVLVIFDRSDSMNSDFQTPTGVQPKYQAAGDALLAAIAPIQNELTVGAILFPTKSGILLCSATVDPIWQPTQIAFGPGAQFAQKWSAWWAANQLILGTPLNRAFDAANDSLVNSGLAGKIAVVVFTDGEPVCTDGTPAPQRAAEWLKKGILTYVIGLPGAASSTLLNNIAVQGGTNAFLLPTDSTQLEQELSTIASKTVSTKIDSCTITLNPPPPDPTGVHLVVVDGVSGKEYQVTPGPDGWQLTGGTATLLGATCTDALAGRFSSVRFDYGCVDVPELPR